VCVSLAKKWQSSLSWVRYFAGRVGGKVSDSQVVMYGGGEEEEERGSVGGCQPEKCNTLLVT
jgi:hypothetical protein